MEKKLEKKNVFSRNTFSKKQSQYGRDTNRCCKWCSINNSNWWHSQRKKTRRMIKHMIIQQTNSLN